MAGGREALLWLLPSPRAVGAAGSSQAVAGAAGPICHQPRMAGGPMGSMGTFCLWEQVQAERDELYQKFTQAINEVQQKTGFKNLLLERKLKGLLSVLEKKEVELSEAFAASNLDPGALSLVSNKLEVPCAALGPAKAGFEGQRLLWGEHRSWSLRVPIAHGCSCHVTHSRHSQGHVRCRRARRLSLESRVCGWQLGTDLSLRWDVFRGGWPQAEQRSPALCCEQPAACGDPR